MFNLWDTTEVIVTDPGLKRYINLAPVLVPTTMGRETEKQFWKSKKPIVERLMNKVMVSGHIGKKHKRSSGRFTGHKIKAFKAVKECFVIIENKTKKNPIQIFIEAIEKSAPREGITTIEYGGVRYPKSVDVAPQRRIDLSLRWITQGAHIDSGASKGRKSIAETLANQIMLTASGDQKAMAINKKIDLERQARASR